MVLMLITHVVIVHGVAGRDWYMVMYQWFVTSGIVDISQVTRV